MPPHDPESARWFATEVQPHAAGLRSYLAGQFPYLPDADDIVQESLLRVVRAHRAGRVDSPRALLFATARNLALDLLRRQRVVAFEPITEVADSSVFIG